MKKFVSLLMAVVMLATMLSVFAVPAFAEETKTADDYLQEAEALISKKKYNEAADAYCKAGELLEQAGDIVSAADAYYKAGETLKWASFAAASAAAAAYDRAAELYQDHGDTVSAAAAYYKAGDMFRKAGDSDAAADAYKKSIELYTEVIHACLETAELKEKVCDSDAAADAYSDAGKAYERVAELYGNVGDSASKADAYMKAAACYRKASDWLYASLSYEAAAMVYDTELYDYISAGDTYMKAGACWMKAGEWGNARNMFGSAATQYNKIDNPYSFEPVKQQTETGAENESDLEIVDADFKLLKDYYRAMAFAGQANADWHAGDDKEADSILLSIGDQVFSWDSPIPSINQYLPGSTLSEGNIWIVIAIAAAVVFGFGGFFIGRKKKKPALAGGAESDE